ncbi:hypothetical protein AX15_006994 [Amanita polypyramis BW_CC]|nr:hypothetical protein AX15_006994 [Amanita polypyramis BW_CC]
MTTPRHEFYESDESLTLTVFDRGADPANVSVKFEPRRLSYANEDKSLLLEPLKGQIDPNASSYTVGKVKVEIKLVKLAARRWGALVGDEPDLLTSIPQTTPAVAEARNQKKNWEGITSNILDLEKEKSVDEDPNVGGDTTLNSFFQKLFADADDDTKRAMLKSFQESGGTTLSTNWDEVGKGKVPVKPPSGSEWKKWN